MRVLVLGAGGIIGQHMKLDVPLGFEAFFTRREEMPEENILGLDVYNPFEPIKTLRELHPDVVINLMGESNTDIVEKNSHHTGWVNAIIPEILADYCLRAHAYLIHVSSQGVFGGECPPYHPMSERNPVNLYGKQKVMAEDAIMNMKGFDFWTIARVTFVLGSRPHLRWGRSNPFESMLQQPEQRQVKDRYFSPAFARDVARVLWKLATYRHTRRIVHVGHPVTTSRFQLAHAITAAAGMKVDITAVSHDDFKGLAPRPLDTTYSKDAIHLNDFDTNLHQAIEDWRRVSLNGLVDEKGFYAGP